MEKKYKTEEDPETGLLRIIALKDFLNIKKGRLGGLIEKEDNLSQEGDCWVYENAKVWGNAKVYEDAKIYDYARVYGNAQIYGRAGVYGEAQVYDNAEVSGKIRVCSNARICGNVKLWSSIPSLIETPIENNKDYIISVAEKERVFCAASLRFVEDFPFIFKENYLNNIQTIRQLYGEKI